MTFFPIGKECLSVIAMFVRDQRWGSQQIPAALPLRLSGLLKRCLWRHFYVALLCITCCAGNGIAQTVTLTKQALNPTTGAVLANAVPGQQVKYVISYSLANGPLASAVLTDTMTGLTYVPGSLQAGPNWTVQNQPQVFVNGVATLLNTPLLNTPTGGLSLGESVNPPIGAFATVTGGDGWTPIVVGNNAYEIFHHSGQNNGIGRINCLSLTTGATCPGYPMTLDSSFATAFSTNYVLSGSKIYFQVTRPADSGVACWDTQANAACSPSYVAVAPPSPNPGLARDIGGLAQVTALPGKMFMQQGGSLYCYDTVTNSACGAPWTNMMNIIAFGGANSSYVSLLGIGNFVIMNSAQTAGDQVTCLDFSAGLPGVTCSGTWPKISQGFSIFPHPTAAGTIDGFCLSKYLGFTAQPGACYDFSGGALPQPTYADSTSNGTPYWLSGTSQVLLTMHGSSATQCWDFATGANCTGFTDGGPGAVAGIRRWQQPNPGGSGGVVGATIDYGYVSYGQAGCRLGLGDSGLLWSFDAQGNSPCLNSGQLITVPPAANQYCDGAARNFAWSTVTISNLPPEVSSGNLTVYQADGVTVFQSFPIASTGTGGATQVFPVNTLPYTGAAMQVRVSLTYSGAPSASAPLTYVSGQITVTGASTNPQICYQATVDQNACDVPTSQTSNTVSFGNASSSAVVGSTATNLQCAAAKLDVAKTVGTFQQVGVGSYQVPYSVAVSNTGVSIVRNVQVMENLVRTFFGAAGIPAGATLSVATPVINPLGATPAAKCAAAGVPFNGSTQQALLSGDQTLVAGEGCSITFVAAVNYGANPVPLTVRNNFVYASNSTTPQTPGGSNLPTIPNDPAVAPTYLPATTLTDTSTGNVVRGAPGGIPPIPAVDPTTVPSPAPVTFSLEAIDVTKSAGVAVQTGLKSYDVGFTLTIGDQGTHPTSNVQLVDNLVRTFFGAGGIPSGGSLTVSTPVITPVGATSPAKCAPAVPAFNGNTQPALLAGNQNFAPGDSCTISFVMSVNFGTAQVPAVRLNQAFANGNLTPQTPGGANLTVVSNDPTVPGFYPVDTTTFDESTNVVVATPNAPGLPPPAPPLPPTQNNDTPTLTPVLFPRQSIDVVKTAGIPKLTGAGSYAVGYAITVGNKGNLNTTNVQVVENMVRAYFGANGIPAGASLSISDLAINPLTGTAAGKCAAAVPAFDGNTQPALLLGNQTLSPNEGCAISFVVNVSFGTNTVPTIVNNQAFATGNRTPQTPGTPNVPVVPNNPATPPTYPPTTTTTDDSTNVVSTTPGAPGAPPTVPPLPPTDNGDTPSLTPVSLVPVKINIAKEAGVPEFLSGKAFAVPYVIVVGNPGPQEASNIQVSDNLMATFPTATTAAGGGGISVKPGSYTVTNGSGTTVCQPASSYDGLNATTLLAGNFTLQANQSCVISFIALVNFGSNEVPLVKQDNTGLASTSTTTNAGYTFGTDGKPLQPPVNYTALAASVDVTPVTATTTPGAFPPIPGTPNSGIPGVFDKIVTDNTSSGIPTPVLLQAVELPLFVIKTVNKTEAEIGDTVRYQVTVKTPTGGLHRGIVVTDRLPAGFRYVPGTAVLNGVKAADPGGGVGPVLTFPVGDLPRSTTTGLVYDTLLRYTVRVGVGSQQGDGVNRAIAQSSRGTRSNEARAKVKVKSGVFTSDACVAGKVFVDCNNNHIQDAEEIGIPGVRLYLEDGTYFVTDVEGKYSYCGLKATTHVIKIDPITMPRRSRIMTTSSRNLGDGNSLFLDTKNGELLRADFIEGSCSNAVIEQVKARRTQGEIRSVETEANTLPALKFSGKAPDAPRQATDTANQIIVKPRISNSGATEGAQNAK